MTRHDRQGQLLTVGQVARQCGVSVDTVRAWARSGRLPASRTAGGQRRFREADVVAVAGVPAAGPSTQTRRDARPISRVAAALPRTEAHPPRPQDWVENDPMVLEARTQLEVTRAEAERDALARQVHAEERHLERELATERKRQAELTRLEVLKAFGRNMGADLPLAWFSTLTTDLEGFVSASNVPAALPDQQARALVAGRVQRVRERFRAEESQQLKAVLDSMKIRRLKQLGQSMVASRTLIWSSRESEMARSVARRELDSQVDADWTESDVRALVEDVLAEWDDDDDSDAYEGDEDLLEDGDETEEDEADFG